MAPAGVFAVPARYGKPVLPGNDVIRECGGRSTPGAVVLKAGAEIVRGAAVGRDAVALLDREPIEKAPVLAAILREIGAAVVALDHALRVRGIDPHGVMVDVHRLVYDVRRLAAIVGFSELEPQKIDTVGIIGRDLERREVEPADVVGMIVRDLLPVISEIVGGEQRSLTDGSLEQRVDAVPARWARSPDPMRPMVPIGEPSLGSRFRRRRSSATRPNRGRRHEGSMGAGRPARLPRTAPDHWRAAWRRRSHRCDRRHTTISPAPAAVGRHIHAAVGARAPFLTERRDHHVIRIVRIDHDATDLADALQAHRPPGLAAIRRQVHPGTGDHVVADVRLTRADPYQVGVRGGDRDGADRARRCVVEDGIPVQAAVGRLEHAAAGRADVVNLRVAGDAGHSRHPAAGDRRAEIAELQLRKDVLGRLRAGLAPAVRAEATGPRQLTASSTRAAPSRTEFRLIIRSPILLVGARQLRPAIVERTVLMPGAGRNLSRAFLPENQPLIAPR